MTECNFLHELESLLQLEGLEASQELYDLLVKTKLSLMKGSRQEEVLAQFAYAFSFYLMTNNYEAPKEVLAFASQINHHLPKQRGRGSALKILALSLMGLSK